jgi:hypothetical protein
VSYSLSPPRLASKTVPRHERQREALGQFRFDEDGSAFIALIHVLLVDRGVMLLGVIAALENGDQELAKLAEGVTRVVDMSLRLEIVSRIQM